MATILDELQMSSEKAAEIISYLHNRSETIDQHIHASVTYSHPTTQLLFSTRNSEHLPESGLNPVVDAAAYLFFLMGKLKLIKQYSSLDKLHDELVDEVLNFKERIKNNCRHHQSMEEYTPIVTFALCMALDDMVSDTAWGGQGKWQPYHIATTIFGETASRKGFYAILERLLLEPNVYLDVVEFLYICLNFGLKYHQETDASELNYAHHQKVMHFLYKYIQAQRGNASKVLGPFPIRPKQRKVAASFRLSDTLSKISEHSQALLGKLGALRRPAFVHSNPLLVKSLLKLEKKFESTIHFIDQTSVNIQGNNIALSELPWFLLIGLPGAGKSSLLCEARVKFILGKKRDSGQRQPAVKSAYDWWITQNAVLVDVPGRCMSDDQQHLVDSEVWRHFLCLTQKSQKRKVFGGVIVAVSVTELVDRQYRDELILGLKSRIADLQQAFGKHVPFYFVVTKMDLLPGFLDFFSDCTAEDQAQAWGLTMPLSAHGDALTSVFIQRFNALIKVLNNQVIQRLHHERDLHAKSNIKDFPLYVERLKDEFAGMLNALKAHDTRFCFKGIYLTSALQQGAMYHDNLQPRTMSAGDDSEKMFEIMRQPEVRHAPYFIRQFILQGILQ